MFPKLQSPPECFPAWDNRNREGFSHQLGFRSRVPFLYSWRAQNPILGVGEKKGSFWSDCMLLRTGYFSEPNKNYLLQYVLPNHPRKGTHHTLKCRYLMWYRSYYHRNQFYHEFLFQTSFLKWKCVPSREKLKLPSTSESHYQRVQYQNFLPTLCPMPYQRYLIEK